MEDIVKMLPGGPSAIHIYGKYIFPPVNDMSVLEQAASEGLFPTFASIFYPALFYAVLFGALRSILTKLFFRVRAEIISFCSSIGQPFARDQD
jgi:hypothetical protein